MIITRCIMPPIPLRSFDWVAFVDGQEDGPTGHGRSEAEALRDLCEQLACLLDEAKE